VRHGNADHSSSPPRLKSLFNKDGSGEIDLDEFKAALFLCDPTHGNPVGFKPSKYMTPLDAFETFDEDKSGNMPSNMPMTYPPHD
jgi:Ca2+-binding EF-hand superfamily protein